MRTSPSERTAHVALWRESGLSKAAYCRESGISYQSFVSWAREPGAGRVADPVVDDRPAFVELIDDRPRDPHGPTLRVLAGGMELCFLGSAQPAWIGAVLRAVAGC